MKIIIAGSSVAYCARTAQVPDWQEKSLNLVMVKEALVGKQKGRQFNVKA
jgi:hypothetical protein